MTTLQLRVYTLKTPDLARTYTEHWRLHIDSLALFHVTTRAVYMNETDPKQVIAIVEYREGDDPETTVKAFLNSDGFKKDMEGFDLSNFEKVETSILRPLDFSPSK